MTQKDGNDGGEINFEQLLRDMPPQQMMAIAFVRLLAQQKEWGKIIYLMSQVIANLGDEEAKAAIFWRGLAYSQKGEADNAIADFSRVIDLTPGMVEAYYYRALTYLQAGEETLAQNDIKRMTELDPDGRRIVQIMRLTHKD